jgi:hypothetical protein
MAYFSTPFHFPLAHNKSKRIFTFDIYKANGPAARSGEGESDNLANGAPKIKRAG